MELDFTIAVELERLLKERLQANQALSTYHLPLDQMTARERAEVDRLSRQFRGADEQITAILRTLTGPARLARHTLWLTADRLHFVVLDNTTQRPWFARPLPPVPTQVGEIDQNLSSMLYQYPGRHSA